MNGRKLEFAGMAVLGVAACGMAMVGPDTHPSLQHGLEISRAAGPNQAAAPEQAFPGAGRLDNPGSAPADAPFRSGVVAYVSGSGGEPWGMPGNVHALDDVFGAGNWTRLDFPTAVGNGLWDYGLILLEGGDGADAEFTTFVNTYRADMEAWVNTGGSLIINAARGGGGDLDLGFGITLHHAPSDTGTAADTSHPIYDGPYGFTGGFFEGAYLAHDYLTGAICLMTGDDGGSILAEKSSGAGHVIAGGLSLPFFGEHEFWSPNCAIMHRNMLAYAFDRAGELELKYLQPIDCEEGGYYSNLNSDSTPYVRYDDFICNATGAIGRVAFWGASYDHDIAQGCGATGNLQAIRIDFYEWLSGGPCGFLPGDLLCSYTIPAEQLQYVYECTWQNACDYYKYTVDLPEPCFQLEGQHFVLMIGGILLDPNDTCVFIWTPSTVVYGTAGASQDRLNSDWFCSEEDQAFELYTIVPGEDKYEQPPNCDDYLWFSNVNSNVNPWIRMDDFVCYQTGTIQTIVFWGNGWDISAQQECGLDNLPHFLVEIYKWIPEGPCNWMPGELLCSYTIPTEDLAPVYECTGPQGDCFRFTADLPEPCYQEEGVHYVLRIGAVVADPEDSCVFGWLPTPTIHGSVAASYDPWLNDWHCGDYDQSFALYTEIGEPCPWDFDGDGDVDTADLLHLLACWGTPCGDVDGDGDTDTADLLALLGAWGECP